MSAAYDKLLVEVGNMSKRETTAVFDYIDELRAQVSELHERFEACFNQKEFAEHNWGLAEARVQSLEVRIQDAEAAIRSQLGDESEYWLRWMPLADILETGK